MTEFYQIYYREEQKTRLFPFAIPVWNLSLTIFFENDVIKDLVPRARGKSIAVCSWKLKEKLRMYIGRPREITQELLDSEYDVLAFTKNTKHHQMLGSMDAHHKGSREILKRILHLCSISMPSEVKIPIYQNHHSSRTEIYQDYVKNYLVPAMWIMKNEPEVNKLIMQDSNYSQLARNTAVSPEYLQEKIGVPFYPLAPFLLERLFSIYCHNHKIKVTPL